MWLMLSADAEMKKKKKKKKGGVDVKNAAVRLADEVVEEYERTLAQVRVLFFAAADQFWI